MNPPHPLWHNQAILNDAEFHLNGNLAELRRLEAETTRFCQEHALADEVAFDLNLALEELFTNALRHGGCEGMDDAVHIRLQLCDHAVQVEYADRGSVFDPVSVAPPDLEASLDERPIGGLGIHLVQQVMRDLRYRRTDGWNQITMRRPISEGGSEGSSHD